MSEHHLYEREMLALGQENSLSKLIAYIPDHASVLDVGCATGRLGEYLQHHTACMVDAIEENETSAQIARAYYRTLYPINLESEESFSFIKQHYDVIVLADFLEHVQHPELVLQRLSRNLTANGKFLISIPNVGHVEVMLQLLQGSFVYQAQGLLDKTHLRFFSRQNLAQFFADAQLQQWRLLDRVVIGIQGTEFAGSVSHGISPAWLPVFSALPESNTYQFLLEASPSAVFGHLSYEQEVLEVINNGIYIHVTLHYCSQEHPDEYRSLTQVCYLHDQMFMLTFSLPPNITKLRFDPADIAGIMQIKHCQLEDVGHTPVWTLTEQCHITEYSASLTMGWSADHIAILEMSDADPWFVLPVSPEALAVAQSFVVQFSWPQSHDYWLLETQWRDKYTRLALVQQKQQADYRELSEHYQHLHAQSTSVKAMFVKLLMLIKNKIFY